MQTALYIPSLIADIQGLQAALDANAAAAQAALDAAAAALDEAEGDARYGRLGAANTWTGAQTVNDNFSVSVGGSSLSVAGAGLARVSATSWADLSLTAGQNLNLQTSTFGSVNAIRTDAVTNTLSDVLSVRHRSTGTPAAGFGARLLTQLKSSTTNDRDASAIDTIWTDATDATRTSAIVFNTVSAGGALTERLRADAGSGANTVGLRLWDANSGAMKRVEVGAADSGGAGKRMLVIAN